MTPLSAFLQAATPDQRARAAALAGTTQNYLYQLAGCHRGVRGVSAPLALSIEAATRQLHDESGGALPIVTVGELATMCALSDFAPLGDEKEGNHNDHSANE